MLYEVSFHSSRGSLGIQKKQAIIDEDEMFIFEEEMDRSPGVIAWHRFGGGGWCSVVSKTMVHRSADALFPPWANSRWQWKGQPSPQDRSEERRTERGAHAKEVRELRERVKELRRKGA